MALRKTTPDAKGGATYRKRHQLLNIMGLISCQHGMRLPKWHSRQHWKNDCNYNGPTIIWKSLPSSAERNMMFSALLNWQMTWYRDKNHTISESRKESIAYHQGIQKISIAWCHLYGIDVIYLGGRTVLENGLKRLALSDCIFSPTDLIAGLCRFHLLMIRLKQAFRT